MGQHGMGYNNVDIEAAKKKGLMNANVPSYCVEEVSDHFISFISELIKALIHMEKRLEKDLGCGLCKHSSTF